MVTGEERVLRRMRGQHGLITRAQALADGMTRGQIERSLRTGRWVREARGVYRHAAAPPTPLSKLLAACMVHDGLASHRSAAALQGIDGFTLGRIELSVPRGRKRAMKGVTLHESTQMNLARPVVKNAVPSTGLPRWLVLDLAAVVSRKRLDRAIDAVLRDRRLRPADLFGVLVSHSRQGRNGCAALRSALDRRFGDDPVPLSEWSRMVEDLLVASGLDRPRLEYRICGTDGTLIAQVDLAYPDCRLAIELDSRLAPCESFWRTAAGATAPLSLAGPCQLHLGGLRRLSSGPVRRGAGARHRYFSSCARYAGTAGTPRCHRRCRLHDGRPANTSAPQPQTPPAAAGVGAAAAGSVLSVLPVPVPVPVSVLSVLSVSLSVPLLSVPVVPVVWLLVRSLMSAAAAEASAALPAVTAVSVISSESGSTAMWPL